MDKKRTVWLINRKDIPHYRVPVYNYLFDYLDLRAFQLTVIAEGLQKGNPHKLRFPYRRMDLSFSGLAKLFYRGRPDIIIFWTDPELYTFPLLLLSKYMKIKIIHWGHRRDQQRPHAFHKNLVYDLEHCLDDAIILYAEHLRDNLPKRFWKKIFIANNTLNLVDRGDARPSRESIKSQYGIHTGKNIICMGRMQGRKRIGDLVEAFHRIPMKGLGLILAGPDDEQILKNIQGENIFKTGPVYGEDSLNLLSASDVYCLPGAIGLGIVDAFYCGLPIVTERVFHGPEITYLKDGVNGFIVPKGDISQLASKLKTLLTNDELRDQFSRAARTEILTNGHIDRLCEGFLSALRYTCEPQRSK